MSTAYCFDRFEVQPVERRLLVDGQPAPIGARAFDLLTTLVENPGRLLTKNELLDRVWPGLVVEEANLHVQVSSLRKLLGPKVIATIPGQGYKLAVAPEAAEVAAAPAPAPTAGARRHNLPETTESLIGRDSEVELLNRLLDQHRLVTVVGGSGIGKTRLAQAVARQRFDAHADGVWWVDLAALRSADQVAPAIAQAIGVQWGDGDALDALRPALAQRDTMLALDNCEHLVEPVAAITVQLLDSAPQLRLLATSLEPLKLSLEHTCRLDGLAVPPTPMSLELARCFGAFQLLEQRAQAADHRFRIDEAAAAKAIDLCRHLDGIALAIEMAAARLPLLGFDAVLARLGGRLQLLRNTSRDAPARQRTLGATLDWSHALLNSDEQAVLRRLSVFVGSFGLDAALAVATDRSLDEGTVLDALFGLVDKSMLKIVQLEPPRYRLLESTRLYAHERLLSSGEAADVERRHGQTLARVAGELDLGRWSMSDRELTLRFTADRDDMQAAFDRACEAGHSAVAADLGIGLNMLGSLLGIGGRRQRMRKLARLLPDTAGAVRAQLLRSFANNHPTSIDEVSRLDAAREMVALRREGGDPPRLYEALAVQATVCVLAGELEEAERAIAEGRHCEQADWPTRLLAQLAYVDSEVRSALGDQAGFVRAMQTVLDLSRRAGLDIGTAGALQGLAEAALLAMDLPRAIDLSLQAMEHMQRCGMAGTWTWGSTAAVLGAVQAVAGRLDEARDMLCRAQPILASVEAEGLMLSPVALLCVRQGHSAEAARLVGGAQAWFTAQQHRPDAVAAMLDNITSAELEIALGADGFARERTAGAAMSGEQALVLMRSLLGVGAP